MSKASASAAEAIARKAALDNRLLTETIAGITSDIPEIKYRSGKVLMILSQENPQTLYPKWDHFVDLLSSKNTFMKSIGIVIISHLTKVDSKDKFDKIFDKFYKLLNDESMITAANLVGHSGVIARAKPKLQNKITNRLLAIDNTDHSPECRNIIKGKAIQAFGEYFNEAKNKKKIIDFVKRELKSTRPATRKKAEKFLKKWQA